MKLQYIFFGICLVSNVLLASKVKDHLTSRRIQFTASPQSVAALKYTNVRPVGISVSSLDIWLPLIPSQINKDVWETTSNGVSYWVDGVIPGNKGNAILYGHNWHNLLGKLPEIKPGDLIEIYFDNNTKKTFSVTTTQEVDPENSSVLKNTTDNRLTLYTCVGFLDSKRFIVVAHLLA